MSNWVRPNTPQPKPSEENPGKGFSLRTAFANSERTWTEEVNLVEELAKILSANNYSYYEGEAFLELEAGFILQPQMVELQPLEDSGVRTVSTIEVSHPELVPAGLFEYQHSTGQDLADSFAKGFRNWVELDLPVLTEALNEELNTCLALEVAFREREGRRRIVLGPVSYLVEKDTPPENEEEHPSFCACCLFTNSFEAFKQFLESDNFYGIRLFAMRSPEGIAEADCRVNGREWEPGKEALRNYVQTWADKGVEFRKQYISIQSLAASNE